MNVRTLALAALFCSAGCGALAQTATPTPARQGASELEELVVTATRREERLQDVPLAVTAVSGDTLQKSGIENTRMLTQVIPNLNFSRLQNIMQPTIRGVGTSGSSPGDENNVAVYVDGVYQASLIGNALDLVKVERIEVLRGPQGTLFGRNSTGGLINIITPTPSSTPEFLGRVRAGELGERSGQIYMTTGFGDRVAVSVAANAYKDNGYIKDILRGGTVGDRTSVSGRVKLLVKPFDGTNVTLAANYNNTQDSSVGWAQPINRNTQGRAVNPNVILPTGPFESAVNVMPVQKNRQVGLSLQTSTELPIFNVETTLSYQRNNGFIQFDSDVSPTPVQFTANIPLSHDRSQEVRLVSNSGERLSWIAGVFGYQSSARGNPTNINNATFFRQRQTANSVAVFGEANYQLTDALRLVAGVRYSDEDRDFTQNVNGVTLFDVKASFKQWTPRFSAQYHFSDDANVYATYSRGFKSGVFNAFATSRVPAQPEIIDAYEIGLKADPTPILRTNLAAFFYKYKDMQVSSRDPTNGVYTLQNAANAEIKGVEAEGLLRIFEGLQARASATYLDAKYTSFPGALTTIPLPQGGNLAVPGDVSGHYMPKAPKYTMNLGLTYEHPTEVGTFGASGNLFHSAKVYYDALNRLYQPSYVQVNAEISWTTPDERYRFSVWGENITDELVAQAIVTSVLDDYVTYEKPRRFGVALQAKF